MSNSQGRHDQDRHAYTFTALAITCFAFEPDTSLVISETHMGSLLSYPTVTGTRMIMSCSSRPS
jgi:hypothetical protein